MPHSTRTAGGVLGGLLGLVGLSAVAGLLITMTVTPAVAVSSAAATGAIDMFNNLPSVLAIGKPILPSTIYATDSKGKDIVLATYYDQNRKPVTFDQIAPAMKDAILSSEDPRFYEHGGIDLIGTTRAVLSNLKGGGDVQGGSSISQQYVKNVLVQKCDWNAKTDADLQKCFLEATDAKGTEGYQRKLQEMRYSIALEQRYSKDQILLGYLNIANFGGTTYGIEAAAEHYFGVHASKLSIAQSAVLAGIVQNPNLYRIDQPQDGTSTDKAGAPVNTAKDGYSLTKARQLYVLDRMLKDGKITQKEHDKAAKAKITPKITASPIGCTASIAPYFCQYVTDTVLNSPAFGKTDAERRDLLRKGGLKIYTTLDPAVQKALAKNQKAYTPTHLDSMKFGSAAVSVEAKTGRVLGMSQNTKFTPVGKKDPAYSAVIYAGNTKLGGSIGFPVGSTFKLFTLLEWLQSGKSVNATVDGRDVTLNDWTDSCVPSGSLNKPYQPGNFGKVPGYFGTPMQFTAASLNSGFMAMAHQLDLCKIGKTAASLGVTLGNGQPLPIAGSNVGKAGGPGEILGADNISPMAIAGAYAAVANKGTFCTPHVIDKVIDAEGDDIPVPSGDCKKVIDPKIAATAAYALQGVMNGGSGTGGNPYDGTPLIGKTGTHQDYQTWLVTSSTAVTTANWVGNYTGQGDLFHNYYQGMQLSNIRYQLGRANQGAIDKLYKGSAFPQPDKSLTRRVLVDLPSVVGMSVADATATLKAKGFGVSVGKPVASNLATGVVATQSPGAGRTAGGTQVTIRPSDGKGLEVPDVTGRTSDEALGILRAAGFTNVSAKCQANPGGDGRVTSQSPAPGTVGSPGTHVTATYQSQDCGGPSSHDKRDGKNDAPEKKH